MNKEILYFFFFVLALVYGCAGEEETDQSGDTLAEPTESLFIKPLEAYNSTVRQLLSPDSGVLRGTAFDMKKEHIRALENSQHIETTENYIIYGIDFGLKESADIIYYFDSTNVLRKTELIVYAERETRRDSLFKILHAYFRDRYKEVEKSDTSYVFENSHRVLLSKTGSRKYPNIEIIAKPD